jgi:hypothetical protein
MCTTITRAGRPCSLPISCRLSAVCFLLFVVHCPLPALFSSLSTEEYEQGAYVCFDYEIIGYDMYSQYVLILLR